MTAAVPIPHQKGTHMNTIRVGVNGYGVIGKRVAEKENALMAAVKARIKRVM